MERVGQYAGVAGGHQTVVSILENLVSSNKALLWFSPTDVQIEGFIQYYLIPDLLPLASRLPADLFNLVGFTVGKNDMKEEIGTLEPCSSCALLGENQAGREDSVDKYSAENIRMWNDLDILHDWQFYLLPVEAEKAFQVAGGKGDHLWFT